MTGLRNYQKNFIKILAEKRAIFFKNNLRLKDGRPTPYFINFGKINDARSSWKIANALAYDALRVKNIDFNIIVGPSYKASTLANSMAQELYQTQGKIVRFDYDRKEAKVHGEATNSKKLFVNNAIEEGDRILVIDDVFTSMGTKVEIVNKIRQYIEDHNLENTTISHILAGVDREQSNRTAFEQEHGISTSAVIGAKDMFQYLHSSQTPIEINGEMRPMDQETKATIDTYLLDQRQFTR
jgi:orotate phosphoribosyltransferase